MARGSRGAAPSGGRASHPPDRTEHGLTPEVYAFTAAAAAALAFAELAGRFRSPRQPFGLLARVGRALIPGTASVADLERRLVEAGRPAGLTARDLLAAKFGAACTGAGIGLAGGAVLPGRLGLLSAVAAPAGGFFAPDIWLARRRRARAAAVRRDLPALLDLLRVSIEAGASLPQALAAVGRRSHAPLARMWAGIALEISLGVRLADALEAHGREVPLAEVRSFTAAIERAVRHGAPLAQTLAAQAETVRAARRRAIQEEAARAGPKMQLVVALLLVPSVMLLVAAALLSALAEGGAGRTLGGF